MPSMPGLSQVRQLKIKKHPGDVKEGARSASNQEVIGL